MNILEIVSKQTYFDAIESIQGKKNINCLIFQK